MSLVAYAKLFQRDLVIIHRFKLLSELNRLIKVRALFRLFSHNLNSPFLQNIMKI